MQPIQVQLVDRASSFEQDGVTITGDQVQLHRVTDKVKAGLSGGILRTVREDDLAFDKKARLPPLPPKEPTATT